jgi:5-methylcytosine-specific restriction endonuclease McrBC GTP-binding regulatory subunit McrB
MSTPLDTSSPLAHEYRRLARQGRIEFVSFHPSYSYEEFIEGLTVTVDHEHQIGDKVRYRLQDGLFKRLCTRALVGAMGDRSQLDAESNDWSHAYRSTRRLSH